jgi:hypothetical protein
MMKNNCRNTDWNIYYSKPYKTATYTRKITGRVLIRLIKKHADFTQPVSIAELGGANSCFYDLIKIEIDPKIYYVIDNNELGLKRLQEKTDSKAVSIYNADVLNFKSTIKADIVFSIGLVEHFTVENTAKAIRSHFEIVKDEGLVIISFPTPTLLYRISRLLSELLGLWIFHDERPLEMREVLDEVISNGTLLYKGIIWPIFFTQGIIIAKKS